jgi:hypothetical protein
MEGGEELVLLVSLMVRGIRDGGITSSNSAFGAANEAQSASGVRGTDAIVMIGMLGISIGGCLYKILARLLNVDRKGRNIK